MRASRSSWALEERKKWENLINRCEEEARRYTKEIKRVLFIQSSLKWSPPLRRSLSQKATQLARESYSELSTKSQLCKNLLPWKYQEKSEKRSEKKSAEKSEKKKIFFDTDPKSFNYIKAHRRATSIYSRKKQHQRRERRKIIVLCFFSDDVVMWRLLTLEWTKN